MYGHSSKRSKESRFCVKRTSLAWMPCLPFVMKRVERAYANANGITCSEVHSFKEETTATVKLEQEKRAKRFFSFKMDDLSVSLFKILYTITCLP